MTKRKNRADSKHIINLGVMSAISRNELIRSGFEVWFASKHLLDAGSWFF
jgi:hypothetical protein